MEHRAGRVAALERRGIDDRLERGSGLAPGLRRAVEGALLIVPAADEREDVPVGGIDGHEAALQVLRSGPRLGNLGDARAYGLLGGSLEHRVIGRVHAQTAAKHALRSEHRDELAPDLFLEVLAAGVARRAQQRLVVV